MGEMIDNYTKKKGPNAYILFTTHFINEYKSTHSDGFRRFRGGPTRAINDPLVVEAWEKLSEQERMEWKERAREEKYRMINEYASRIEMYVSAVSAAKVDATEGNEGEQIVRSSEHPETEENQIPQGENSGVMQSQSLRAHSASLMRFLRTQKKRRNLEESKYAPAFFEEISTAKQFEEKRRRERECLTSIWTWRYGDNKDDFRNESFFLISSQSIGVEGDLHIPGTLALVEFSITEGIKREFLCTISEGFSDWNGRRVRTNEFSCETPRSPVFVCREIFGDWLRSSRRDLSSKTPVFYCLVDEYTEVLDCLSHIYAYKENASSRFSPYLLATMDDLLWCILQFLQVPFNVETSANDGQQQLQQSSRVAYETFALSRIVNLHFDDLAKWHSCEYHLKYLQSNSNSHQDGTVGGGDAIPLEKQRCPLAVVRACAGYAKKWVDSGVVDNEVLKPATAVAATAGKGKKSKASEEESTAGAESLKSQDIDSMSFLALSVAGAASDRTLHSNQSEDTLGRRRSVASDLEDFESDDSADIIEIMPEPLIQPVPQLEEQTEEELKSEREVASNHSASVCPSSVCSYTAAEVHVRSSSCGSSRVSVEKAAAIPTADSAPAVVDPVATTQAVGPAMPVSAGSAPPMSPSAVFPHMWTGEFYAQYEAQLRLPIGCRGLGRGVPFGTTDVTSVVGLFY